MWTVLIAAIEAAAPDSTSPLLVPAVIAAVGGVLTGVLTVMLKITGAADQRDDRTTARLLASQEARLEAKETENARLREQLQIEQGEATTAERGRDRCMKENSELKVKVATLEAENRNLRVRLGDDR